MMGGLLQRYGAMTRRERVLVGVAAALTGLVVLVYGVVLPMGRAFDAADARHAEATVRAGRLIAAMRQLDAPPPRKAASGPVDRLVAASAEQAGLVLQSNQPHGEGETQVVVPAAPAAAVLAWLDALGAQGLVVDALTVSPSPSGTVAVSVTLRRPAR